MRRPGAFAGLAVPAATRGPIRPTPGGIYAGLVDPHPPMRGGLTPSSALLPMAGLPAPPWVTFSPMRKSPKNLPEGRPLWVLPLGGIIIPPAARACMRLLLPPERVCATNPDRFATLRWVGESVFFLPRFLRGHTFCFQTVARWGGWLLRFRAKVDFILRCIDRCRAPC